MEQPNRNTGVIWDHLDDRNLIFAAASAQTMDEIIELLGRTPTEIRDRMRELGLVEPVPLPS